MELGGCMGGGLVGGTVLQHINNFTQARKKLYEYIIIVMNGYMPGGSCRAYVAYVARSGTITGVNGIMGRKI